MKSSRVITAAVALVVACVLGWLGYRLANATNAYSYRIGFATLPASDEALCDWLRSQPGVTRAAVTREGNTVVVEFDMPTFGSYPHLDPVSAAEQFGYGGLKGYTTRASFPRTMP